LLRAYHECGRYLESERVAWPRVLRLAALRFGCRVYSICICRAQRVDNQHDPQHFERILKNHIRQLKLSGCRSNDGSTKLAANRGWTGSSKLRAVHESATAMAGVLLICFFAVTVIVYHTRS